MYADEYFARSAQGADEFAATALKLSTLRFTTIARLTDGHPMTDAQTKLRDAAVALRRKARGTKLPRRLRRKYQLGMAGAF